MAETMVLKGTIRAHTDWVPAIASPIDNSDMIVTISRAKSLIVWRLTKKERVYGLPRRRTSPLDLAVLVEIRSSFGLTPPQPSSATYGFGDHPSMPTVRVLPRSPTPAESTGWPPPPMASTGRTPPTRRERSSRSREDAIVEPRVPPSAESD